MTLFFLQTFKWHYGEQPVEHIKECLDVAETAVRPIHHFTDAKIRVHAFYCVMALMIAALLNKVAIIVLNWNGWRDTTWNCKVT